MASNLITMVGKRTDPQPTTPGDKIGLAMKAARALERRHWSTWGRCASLCPELAALLPPGSTRGDKAISAAVDGAKNLATS